jgi:mRNA-degrading endonuclease RelE of RelBE toxin-antitoxin system
VVLLLFVIALARGIKLEPFDIAALLLGPVVLLTMPFILGPTWIAAKARGRKRRKAEMQRTAARLSQALTTITEVDTSEPSEVEVARRTLQEYEGGTYETVPSSRVRDALSVFLATGIFPELPPSDNWAPAPISRAPSELRPAPSPPLLSKAIRFRGCSTREWLIGMSKEFLKAVTNIDRKLQGRILEAIAELSTDPVTVRGDTIRPLSHDLQGLWRYRLGDFRLIYQPLPDINQVLLITFAARGGVYD